MARVLSLLVVLQAFNPCVNVFQMNKDEYLLLRNNMLSEEFQMRIGGKMKLSDSERQVNSILMKLKAKELDIARENITSFPPALHFFRAKPLIDKSEVFKVIRSIPKGKRTQYVYTGRYKMRDAGKISGTKVRGFRCEAIVQGDM